MAAQKYRVKLPGSHVGSVIFYGFRFDEGEAQNVPEGLPLDEFKDWGCSIEPMVPPKVAQKPSTTKTTPPPKD